MNPLISVIMPVHNVEKYIGNAIESILEQTFENYEFIIIDDASTDRTYEIINQYHDTRIRKFQNKIQLGVANTLNMGISIGNAKYIARMDGDDISKVDRFEKQLQFMTEQPDLLISGSHMDLIRHDGAFIKEQKKKIGREEVKISLFFGRTSLAHPSIMIRRDLLNKYHLRYDSAFQYAEDYDLYCRSSQFTFMDNYPESLIQYRLHDDSVSRKFHVQQEIDAQSALYLHLRRLRLPFTMKEFKIHTSLSFSYCNDIIQREEDIILWFKHLRYWNHERCYFDEKLFEQYCSTYQAELIQRRV